MPPWVSRVLPTVLFLCATSAQAAGPADLTGVWSITMHPIDHTCSIDASPEAHQWQISDGAKGVEVTVIGRTSFPRLQGERREQRLTLRGRGPVVAGKIASRTFFELKVHGDGTLGGERLVLIADTSPSVMALCYIKYAIEGKRT